MELRNPVNASKLFKKIDFIEVSNLEKQYEIMKLIEPF